MLKTSVLFDNFNSQCTESLLKLLDVNNINSDNSSKLHRLGLCSLLELSLTELICHQIQPIDISVNKCAKNICLEDFNGGMLKELCLNLRTSKRAMVPV